VNKTLLTFILAGTLSVSNVVAEQSSKQGGELKVLITYYSRTGNTERVVNDVAKLLNADTEKLVDKKSRKGILGFIFGGRDAVSKNKTVLAPVTKDAGNYDIIILGTPIWAGNMPPALRTYVESTKGKFKNVAYIITSGSSTPEKIVADLDTIAGKKAVEFLWFDHATLMNKEQYNKKIIAFTEQLKKIGK